MYLGYYFYYKEWFGIFFKLYNEHDFKHTYTHIHKNNKVVFHDLKYSKYLK